MKQRENIFDDIAFWIIGATACAFPIFFLPVSWVGLSQAKFALLGIGAILASCFFITQRIKDGKISIVLKPIYALFVLIPLVYLVSSLLSLNVHKSLIGGAFSTDTFHFISLLFIFTFLLANLVNTPKRIASTIFIFSLSILLAGALQLVRIFAGDVFSFGLLVAPASTLVGKWNDLVVLSIVFLGILLISLETIRLKKWIMAVLLLLAALPFFFMSLSSIVFDMYFFAMPLSVFVGVAAIVIFAYVFSLRKVASKALGDAAGKKATSFVPLPSLTFLALALVVFAFANPIASFLTEKTNVYYAEAPLTWRATSSIVARVVPSNPVFGTGPDSFSFDWATMKPLSVNNTAFWNLDVQYGVGIIPTSIVTTGILGFILWISFYVLVVALAIRVLFSSKGGAQAFTTKAILAFSVLFTTFIMFFYVPGESVIVAHFLMIGLLLAFDAQGEKRMEIALGGSQPRHFLTTLTSIIIILSVLFWGYRVVAKALAVYNANGAAVSQSEEEALAWVNSAITFDSSNPVFYQMLSRIYLSRLTKVSSLSAKEVEAKKAQIEADISSAVSNAVRAESLDPQDFRNTLFTGNVVGYLGSLGMKDAHAQAAAKYLSASALSPTNPLPFIFASGAYLSSGDDDAAKKALAQAISLKPDWNDSPEVLASIQALVNALNNTQSVDEEATDQESESEEEVSSE